MAWYLCVDWSTHLFVPKIKHKLLYTFVNVIYSFVTILSLISLHTKHSQHVFRTQWGETVGMRKLDKQDKMRAIPEISSLARIADYFQIVCQFMSNSNDCMPFNRALKQTGKACK